MRIMYKIIKFLKAIFFGDKELPDVKKPEDVICMVDLTQCINKFRLDHGLLPYFYLAPLEDIAQEIANNNYRNGILVSYVDVSVMALKFCSFLSDLQFTKSNERRTITEIVFIFFIFKILKILILIR